MTGARNRVRILLAATVALLIAVTAFARCARISGVASAPSGTPDAAPASSPDPHEGLREPAPPPPTLSHEPAQPPGGAGADFASRVRPLLEERCSPCHFPGGQMHDRLPFDREETVRALGKRLFTRIKDPATRAILESFLELPADGER